MKYLRSFLLSKFRKIYNYTRKYVFIGLSTAISQVGWMRSNTVGMESSIVKDTSLCTPVEVNMGFEEMYELHLEDRRVSQS
jgi:hypothetical protein